MPEKLRAQIDDADRRRCRYCFTAEANSGVRLTHDHIVPRSKGGETSFGNVCLACSACNEHKGTGETVPLFNPRTQRWSDHFTWSDDATRIEASTVIGRATVVALRMKQPRIVTARERWARLGWHPPGDN